VDLDDQGFNPSYTVEANPEFPGNGVWSDPVFHLHRDQVCGGSEDFRSTWGEPLVVRVTDANGAKWIAMVESGGMHSFRGLLAGPGDHSLVIANGGAAYVIDTRNPHNDRSISTMPVVNVSAIRELGYLLLSGYTDLTAVDEDGVVWRTDRIVLDDLSVVEATASSITVSGSTIEGGSCQLTIDPQTGLVNDPRQIRVPPQWQDRWHWLRPSE